MWFCLCVELKRVGRKSFDRRRKGTGRETLRLFQHSKFHFIDDPIVAAHHLKRQLQRNEKRQFSSGLNQIKQFTVPCGSALLALRERGRVPAA
jgi:hypothetical protein